MVPETPQADHRDEPSELEEDQLLGAIANDPDLRKRRTQFELLRRLQDARRKKVFKSHREIAREFEFDREVDKNKNKPDFRIESIDESCCDDNGQHLLRRLARTLAKFYAGPFGGAVDWVITLKDGVLSYSPNRKKNFCRVPIKRPP
jgi:hypothetical protein